MIIYIYTINLFPKEICIQVCINIDKIQKIVDNMYKIRRTNLNRLLICLFLAMNIVIPIIAYTGRSFNSINESTEIKPSETFLDQEYEFLEGIGYNLTISNNGYLKIGYFNWWNNMNPATNPSARWYHSMVYDSANDIVILFGGNENNLGYDDETWIYNFTDNSWTNMNPATKPSARWLHSMVYDSANDIVILFGGSDGDSDDETWIYNFTDNSWTNMNPATKPSPRESHSMVYDPLNDRVILFGGYNNNTDNYNDETWIYNFTDNSWINMNPATKPSARELHSMVYDTNNDQVILFGGYNYKTTYYNDETWIYNFTDNSWVNMNPTIKPSARGGHSMAYDSTNDKVILFGGFKAVDNWVENVAWVYNFTDNSWINMGSAINPGIGGGNSMIYDSINDKVILFGGPESELTYSSKTWIYNWTNNYFHQGTFDSKVRAFDNFYNFTGDIAWTLSEKPLGTSFQVQIGFSPTLNEADFLYTSLQSTGFIFQGICKYFKYRIVFKSDSIQSKTPLLYSIDISYSLKKISSNNTEDLFIITSIASAITMAIGIVIGSAFTSFRKRLSNKRNRKKNKSKKDHYKYS